MFCNVPKSAVIPALDARNIYDVPLQYHAEGLDDEVLKAFGIDDAPPPDLARWHDIMDRLDHTDGEVTIGVVGKYVGLPDAYKSLHEALVHGGLANRVKVNIRWLDAEMFEGEEADLAAKRWCRRWTPPAFMRFQPSIMRLGWMRKSFVPSASRMPRNRT